MVIQVLLIKDSSAILVNPDFVIFVSGMSLQYDSGNEHLRMQSSVTLLTQLA